VSLGFPYQYADTIFFSENMERFVTIYSFENDTLAKVDTTTFNSEGILERQHLQTALKNQISVVAPDCLVISEEFSEWSEGQRRIDLLAIDQQANLVVIELKRDETGEHMELQAIRYAAMVSTLTFSRAVEIFNDYLMKNHREEDAESSLLEFLGWDDPQEDKFALDVRVVLVSSNFSKEITTSVMWLNERNIDIRCVRIIPHKYQGQVLIDVQQIIPLPEAESYQVRVRQQSEERREARQTAARDYTQYLFDGVVHNKRHLVLAVIQKWIAEHPPQNLADLNAAFPREIRGGAMFTPVQDAQEINNRGGIARHFLGEDEIIRLPDQNCFAVSNQWGRGNIEKFIEKARGLGFQVEEA